MTADDFAWIPAQTTIVGSDAHYPEEAPAHEVTVDGFWMQRHQVTNAQFGGFVDATGYVTVAERPLNPDDYPGAPAANVQPGSMVFHRTAGPVDLRHINQWWTWTPGACWNHPRGPRSSWRGREHHPVVHIAFEDAAAYADWAAARVADRVGMGGRRPWRLRGATYTWGDEPERAGQRLANYWHGEFPYLPDTGYGSTQPVGSFPANGYGLHDMAGNVWEWTIDWWADDRHRRIMLRRRQLRPRSAAVPDRSQGGQGRIVPVRRQLLSAVPARRTTAADGGHRDEPHRVPMCAAGVNRPSSQRPQSGLPDRVDDDPGVVIASRQ